MEPVTQEIKEIENAEVLQDQEPELKHIRKVEEEVLPLIVIDDDDPPVSTLYSSSQFEMTHFATDACI